MVELFANSGDSDQMSHSVASDLDLHCLPSTRLGFSDYNGLISIRIVPFPISEQISQYMFLCRNNVHCFLSFLFLFLNSG